MKPVEVDAAVVITELRALLDQANYDLAIARTQLNSCTCRGEN